MSEPICNCQETRRGQECEHTTVDAPNKLAAKNQLPKCDACDTPEGCDIAGVCLGKYSTNQAEK